MTGPIKCADCRHFAPWQGNPEVAMGACQNPDEPIGSEYWFAREIHRCPRFSAKEATRDAADHESTGDDDAADE